MRSVALGLFDLICLQEDEEEEYDGYELAAYSRGKADIKSSIFISTTTSTSATTTILNNKVNNNNNS